MSRNIDTFSSCFNTWKICYEIHYQNTWFYYSQLFWRKHCYLLCHCRNWVLESKWLGTMSTTVARKRPSAHVSNKTSEEERAKIGQSKAATTPAANTNKGWGIRHFLNCFYFYGFFICTFIVSGYQMDNGAFLLHNLSMYKVSFICFFHKWDSHYNFNHKGELSSYK